MTGPEHPLDPLTPDEIRSVAEACRERATRMRWENLRFNTITLQEPSKRAMLAYEAEGSAWPPRRAFCVLQAYPDANCIEAVVDLNHAKPTILAWEKIEGVEPLLTPDDCLLAEEIVKRDYTVKDLCESRGLHDMDLVACDPWSVHIPPIPGRLIQTFMYVRTSPEDNHYAHPLDFVPIVDLNTEKVVHIDLPYKSQTPEVPSANSNYHRNLFREWRADLKPLNVEQPEGPSFEVHGNDIEWQKWHMRIGFNYREGLVLHNVGYRDDNRIRPILHRASLVEMAVPYADTKQPYVRKCAFDVGDYGLGNCANSLALGCDCLGHIHYFDAILNDSRGNVFSIPKAVCLHEEDAGMLWKHMDYRTGHAEVRRSRRLVLSFVSTVVNYEYAFYWYFYQDGTIQYEIKLTGELSTNQPGPHDDQTAPHFGTLVGPRVNAQFHQHMFCARLDFAVDDPNGGQGLIVSEMDVLPLEDFNPYGNGFTYTETELTTEKMAQRVTNAETARVWKIKNPARPSAVTGKPIAYKLVPAANPHLMARSRSLVTRRGAFANRNLWVTPHRDEEKWPAGAYTVQSSGGDGLPTWTAENRDVGPGHDPVIWHSFGLTHIPRPEDFPVMPYESVGFTLKPVGFFDSNPAVDLPYGANTASKLAFSKDACCNGGPKQKIPLDDDGKRPSLDHFLGVKSKKVERGFEFRPDFDFHKPPVANGQPKANGSILSNGVH